MSYGICRIQKMTAGAVKGIEIHDKRKKNGVSHTNKDINWELSHLNYELIEQPASYNQAVKNRISELPLTKAVRKDAIVMAQMLITSDHEFFARLSNSQQRKFFEDSFAFACEKYGRENIISATIHMDERTPHLHINFVPVTSDGRLSAKSLFTRKNLTSLHTEFFKAVGSKYGLERGQEGSTAKHLDVVNYKLETAKKELAKTQQRTSELLQTLDNCGDNVLLELADLKEKLVRQQVHATLCNISQKSADEFYNEWERIERWNEAQLSGAMEQDIEELY